MVISLLMLAAFCLGTAFGYLLHVFKINLWLIRHNKNPRDLDK